MRPPRYRFPEEVRATTRGMAVRMVRDGTAPQSPEELDAWIARAPDVREPLERGGYGEAFTADDLFPLLEVFIAKAGGAAAAPARPARAAARGWLVGAIIAAVLAVLLLILWRTAATQVPPPASFPSAPASEPASI